MKNNYRVVWPLICWFLFAALAFGLLCWGLFSRFENDDHVATTLQHISWPFVTFIIALPAVVLFGGNIQELLSLKKTIDDAPQKLATSLQTAEELRTNIEAIGGRITNEMNAALGQIELRLTGFEGRLARISGPNTNGRPENTELSAREKLAAHLESASDLFYSALERWNSDGRRRQNILVVNRGGGNRPDLVDRLRGGGAFSDDGPRNEAIASYLNATFRAQLAARRGGDAAIPTERLDSLRRDAEQAGANLG